MMASDLDDVQFISTGLFIDRVTGGIPRGKITEIYGDPGVGKSTLALQIIAEAQKQGMKCLWADVEYAYETKYAEGLGVENKKLKVIRQPGAETVLDEIEEAVGGGGCDIVVFDSIGGLTPRAETEKSAGEKVIGGQASLVARFVRKIVPLLDQHQTALIVINHSFTDIMSGRIMTSGGAKLGYHKSLSIRLKSKGTFLKSGDKKVGKVIVAEIKKDKLRGQEGAEVEGHLLFGSGFSKSADRFADELEKGIITKIKTTYYRNGEKLGVGITKATEKLKELV